MEPKQRAKRTIIPAPLWQNSTPARRRLLCEQSIVSRLQTHRQTVDRAAVNWVINQRVKRIFTYLLDSYSDCEEFLEKTLLERGAQRIDCNTTLEWIVGAAAWQLPSVCLSVRPSCWPARISNDSTSELIDCRTNNLDILTYCPSVGAGCAGAKLLRSFAINIQFGKKKQPDWVCLFLAVKYVWSQRKRSLVIRLLPLPALSSASSWRALFALF